MDRPCDCVAVLLTSVTTTNIVRAIIIYETVFIICADTNCFVSFHPNSSQPIELFKSHKHIHVPFRL
jgi:hypothetical protein